MDVAGDIAAAARLIDTVAASVRTSATSDDAGLLFKVGRLAIRLDAARALAVRDPESAGPFVRETLLDIARAFPARVDWRGAAEDELLHRRYEAIGHAVLTRSATL